MNILNDRKGRVPFALLGVFLLIGSSITSTIIINIENKFSETTYESLGIWEVDSLISLMQADLAVALNYAATKAMEYVGKNPVTKPNCSKKAAIDYFGNHFSKDKFTFEEIKRFNQNWTRNITRIYFNKYIIANYMNDAFNNGRYAINVISKYENPKKGPIEKWRDIFIKEIKMHLDRENTYLNPSTPLPILSENIRNILSVPVNEVCVYWVFGVPLDIEIKDLETKKIIGKRKINISTLVTSRMPLLMEMAYKYKESLEGEGATILMTLFSELYTEMRALAQYGGMKTKVPNIVDNRWLQYVANAVLLIQQFAVFNSIDPVTIICLFHNMKDFAAQGFPEKEGIKGDIEDIYKNQAEEALEIFGNIDKYSFFSIDEDPAVVNKTKEKVSKPKSERMNITRLAEDLLFNTTYTYYYVNKSGDKWENKTFHEFRGYCFEENEKNWTYVSPPYYIYKNESTGETFQSPSYEGKCIIRNGKYYVYIPPDNQYKREKINKLSDTVLSQLSKIINETYYATFATTINRQTISTYWEEGDPTKDPYWNEEESTTDWRYINATKETEVLENGDVILHFPYTETWVVIWHKKHIFVHKEKEPVVDENGKIIGWKWVVKERETFIEVKEERVKFKISVITTEDVIKPFNITNITLFVNNISNTFIDYNLHNISKDFVKDFVTKIRDKGLKNEISWDITTKGRGITKGKNKYAMKWLYGFEGEVAKALKEIYEEIKKDNISVKITEEYQYRKKDYDETIENHIEQLKRKFLEKKDRYIDKERYKLGDKYKSCGARVIAKMRAWYVNTLWEMLNESKEKLKKSVEDNVTKALEKRNLDKSLFEKRKEAKELNLDISNLLPSLQFGLNMPLKRNETIEEWAGFSIDQKPDYFNYRESEKDLYRFKVKNICLFGPTGLPLLPTPITPWVITINAWYIEVEGEYEEFEITDTIGEMVPHALFGDAETSFVLRKHSIEDEICSGETIGDCEPLEFKIKTVSVCITPPGFVGDIDTYSYTKEPLGQGGG